MFFFHKNNKGSNKKKKSSREETLVLSTPQDVERAMSTVTFLPKRVDVQASLISHSKGPSLEHLLKRVGCLELCIQGKAKCCPRRVFEQEIVAAISHVKQNKLEKLVLKNLDLRRIQVEQEQQEEDDEEKENSLLEKLSTLQNLQELHIVSCRLDSTLQDFLQAMERLPHLKEVTISLTDAIEDVKLMDLLVKTMTSLVERSQITSIAISEFPQDEAFWKSVESSQSLTHLGLAHRRDTVDQQRYWDLLQRNSSIQQLELQVDAGISLTFLMQMLQKNTSIVSLFLHLEEDPTLISQQLTEVLEYHNYTLQKRTCYAIIYMVTK